ncbi:MAG: LamG-like jellyroll fold domain-containing protein [Sphingobacteriales bacterium]
MGNRLLHCFFITVGLILLNSKNFAGVPVITYTPSTNVYTVNTAITTLTPGNSGGAVAAIGFGAGTSLTGATLSNPRGVAIDASGNVYVANSGNNTISKYNSSGTYVSTFGTGATMSFPKGLVFDSSGNAYVLNLGATAGTGSVYKYNSSGVYQSTILSGLNYALGITIDASDNIYIGDQGATTVKKYSTSGTLLLSLPTANLNGPLGVAVDASGNIYVANNGASDITKYNSAGTFQSTFLSGFTSLQAIAIDGAGNIYIGDNATTNIVKVYNQSGTLLTSRTVTDPEGIAIDSKGDMFESSYWSNQMSEYKPTGGYFLGAALPAGLSFDSTTGNISGTPTATKTTTVYTITAYNASGTGSTTVTITCNPTVPTGTGGSVCGSGTATLTASGSVPSGGTYTWYAALSGGSSVGTGTSFTTASITATTTYYVDYTQNGATSTPRTAVVATVNTAPILSTAPTSPTGSLYLSYPFSGNANDVSGNSNNGTLQNAPTLITDRYGNGSSAYSFNGSTQYVSTATLVASPGPQNFSISVWFKTSSAGGKLVGFGSSQTGASGSYDRHIYMTNSGQLYFGLYPGAIKTINTTTTYADGNWHHVVATESTTNGAILYVDGALQATDATMTGSQSYAGYWRVGYDNLFTWTNAPTDYYFNGSLDDVAIYNTALTAAQVYVLYGAGGGSFCAGNSFSLTANTIAGATYAWSGPGSFSSASQNPTVTNAVAGTYTLVVTSSSGCTSTINVTAPSNAITYTWSGAAGTTNPTTAGNWDQLPPFTSTSNLVIPASLSFYPSLTSNETIYGLTIASGASFSLNGYTLSVGCNIINNAGTGGTGILYGNNNSSGITWNGAFAAQSYTGSNTSNTAQLGSMTVNNSAAGTVTISGGPVDIYNLLTITKGNLAVAASPAALTLKSSATQSANVAAIPGGSAITGNVSVERYVTGGTGYRGYRLISSPVYAATVSSNNVFSINYLTSSVFLTGASGGGFDKTGNPTLYLYREDQTPSNATFISGNFEGISAINNSPAYNYSVTGAGTSGTFNIPAGNGVMFFFRGNRASASVTTETTPGYVPVTVTTTTSGTLNQGQVTVHDWYTPASANLGYTGSGTGTNYTVRGFNLVGNPYASSIDWEQYNTGSTTTGIYANNVSNSIYELDPTTNNYDTYQVGGAHTNNGTRTIVSGQGFFVMAANNSSPQLIFNESAKTATQNSGLTLFMATRDDMSGLNSTAAGPHLRLQMAMDSINTDDAYIGFNSAASAQFVYNEDAPYKTGKGRVKLASFSSDGIMLAINKMPLHGSKQFTISLFATANTYGAYKLNMTELEGIPQLYEVWLMDRFIGDSLDMRHNTSYTFDISADTNSYGRKRFQLVIRQNAASGLHLLNFTANKADDGAQIGWVTENEQNYTNFTVERSSDGGATFDVLGGFISGAIGTYSFLDKNPPIGADQYRLKIQDLNGAITYSNAVTLVYGNGNSAIAGNISVYPNPASSMINLVIHQNNGTSVSGQPGLQAAAMTRGLNQSSTSQSFDIKIINITGTTVMTATTSLPTWQNNVGSLPPGTYIIRVINNRTKTEVGKNTFVKL